jgi:F0F1-type ATP synthase membrane subunit c/vacuolar-type H+-ATPase subunit K
MNQPANSREGRLFTARIIWGAMLLGELMFMAVIMLVIWPSASPEHRMSDQTRRIFLYVGAAMLVGSIGMGYFLRSTIAKPGPDGLIEGGRYFTGNLLLWAFAEGAAMFGLVGMLLDQKPWPFLAIVIVAMAVGAINFPTGSGMK